MLMGWHYSVHILGFPPSSANHNSPLLVILRDAFHKEKSLEDFYFYIYILLKS